MQPFPIDNAIFRSVGKRQALFQDNRNSSYTKGNLNPSMRRNSRVDHEATLFLNTWNPLEKEVLGRFKVFCQEPIYVITRVHSISSLLSFAGSLEARCCPWELRFFSYPGFGGLVLGEIGNDFSKCTKFFYKDTPPQGITGDGYQPICQVHKNQYHFATLYYRPHRAPLYSAYMLDTADGKRPEHPTWMYEPQLVKKEEDKSMKEFPNTKLPEISESQAVLEDYRDSIYTKGHLNPSLHQRSDIAKEATFTLTNIVPQRQHSNSGTWERLEDGVLKKFKLYCTGPMYVITGVIPFQPPKMIPSDGKRVSVPEYIWSAYCCPSYKTSLPKHEQKFFPTYAAVGRNDPKSGEEIVKINRTVTTLERGLDVDNVTLEALESILKKRLSMSISLFHEQCKQQ